jgi:hypothetical protein
MNISEALTGAAKGAAAGAIAGPVGAAMGGFGGLVVDIAPDIATWLFGSAGEKTAAMVAQAVEAVTGTHDADAAQRVLAQSLEVVSRLRVQIMTIAVQQQAEANRAAEAQRAADLAAARLDAMDRAGARSQTAALVHLRSGLA